MDIRADLTDLIPYSAGKSVAGAIKLSSNENPLGPSPKALEAIRQALNSIALYPDGRALELCNALAEKMGLSTDQIVIGNGSDELLVLTAQAYIQPGFNAVASESTFSEYTFGVRLAGGTLKKAPLKDGFFDLEALAALIDDKTRIVYLCNPNNPTGTYFTATQLDTFLKKVTQDVLIVLDEAYIDYVDEVDFPHSLEVLARDSRILITRTFSKIYGLAALRVGAAFASPTIISHLLTVKQPFNSGTLSIKAATAALGDSEYWNESRTTNREQRKLLQAALRERGLPFYPSQANFVCFDTSRDASELFHNLQKLGVSIRPLASFGLPTWIRVTVGTKEQNQAFLLALDKALSL